MRAERTVLHRVLAWLGQLFETDAATRVVPELRDYPVARVRRLG